MLDNIKIAIIGLGYVGLPLAVEFGKKYPVLGFDINARRIEELVGGFDKTLESDAEQILSAKFLQFTSDVAELKDYNVFIVTVPTPIDQFKTPDLKPLLQASAMIGKIIKRGDVVIYESTVYPGCTEEDCVPVLEKESGLVFNKDFYCGYSPERINPGDKINTLTKIKKVTSGSTPMVAELVDNLYGSIIEAGTHKAPSLKVAEASKAIENAQRDVNISFINELALIFDRLDIDTNDVLEAAATKWNFLSYKPGLVGGHCIGVDPYYLAHRAEKSGYHPAVILSGRRVNDGMGAFVANKVIKLMIGKNIQIKNAKVIILGIAFKENCPDFRNTRIIDIKYELEEYGCSVDILDPLVDNGDVKKELGIEIITQISEVRLEDYQGIVVGVMHDAFKDIAFAKSNERVIYDVKGMLNREIVDARL